MTPDERFASLHGQLVGEHITDRQLASNTLALWVDHISGDGDRRGWTLWIEPTWHIVNADRVLAGSMQAQDEEEESGWKAVTDVADTLVGRAIASLTVESVTGDLVLGLSDGITVRTFASDPRETTHWRIKDHAVGDSLCGSPNGMHLIKPPNTR
jgi:hypothetical protein